jgi:3-hydroxyacyl-CoA dehydrogenase
MIEQTMRPPSTFGAGPDYLQEAARRAALPPAGVDLTTARSIARVGVVGAGAMGLGIALSCLYAGLEVRLLDASKAAVERATTRAAADLASRAAKGRMSEAAAGAALASLTPARSYADLSDVDLVIEAVFEDLDVKRGVFAALDRACRPGCVLATNTSTLDIDQIAAATERPGDVVGLHFFSPANVMRLLEIVRGSSTAPDILATAIALARRLGKTSVAVGNCYGFAGNRMGEGFLREANLMLLEGASPEAVDRAMTGFGMAMGPFAVADVVGIDVPYRARQANSQAAGGDQAYYRMADLLVELGRFGQKTGRGFYLYPDGSRRPEPDPEVQALAASEAERLGVARRDHSEEEIVDRCVLPIINEGFRILQEGIADRPSDLDVIYTSGYGFPAARGGPMAYADALGLCEVLSRLRGLESAFGGAYWKPADLLLDLVVEGRRLADLPGSAEDRHGG